VHEWDAARALSSYLRSKKLVDRDDVIVGDGFWATGFEDFPNVISVCHGIYSHLTLEDVQQGKTPDMPMHHAHQVGFRKRFLASGGKLVAVSDFIATEMRKQWGFPSRVVNNGIDLDEWRPVSDRARWDPRKKLVIHGVNDSGNTNKGGDHILFLKERLENVRVLSLDEAADESGLDKREVLSLADLVVIPSAYEGNSYFTLEALACDVPVVAYNVGLMYSAWGDRDGLDVGSLMNRQMRSPELTYQTVKQFLWDPHDVAPRKWVSKYSIEEFGRQWREYVEELDRWES
jgi:glycosyltransferase involved in cell wall biosynthesis